MKILNFLSALSLLVVSCNVLADSKVKFAEAFNILAINGSKYEQGLVSQKRLVSLKAGLNRIVIEYEEVFESDDGEDFDIVKSSPFLVEMYLNNNQSYQQKLIKPADSDAARRFAKAPKFSFHNLTDNKPQKFSLTALSGSNEAFVLQESRLPRRKTLMITSSSKPIEKKVEPQVNKDSIIASKETGNQSDSIASKMLDYWWQQASEAEKEAFLKRIKE